MRRKKFPHNHESELDLEYPLIGLEEKKKSFLLAKDYLGLENLLQKLFTQIQNNIYQNKFDKALTETCQKSLILLEDLKRQKNGISEHVYSTIDLLGSIYNLEQIGDRLDEEINRLNLFERTDKEEELERIEETVSFLIKVFNNYALNYPQNIEIPNDDILDFILTIENDWDFELLLIGLAKSQHPRVINILKEFAKDEEKDVRELALKLLEDRQTRSYHSAKDDLKAFVSEDELTDALKKLLEIGKSVGDIDFTNQVYYQLGRNASLEKDMRLGTISYQDSTLTRNQIRLSTIELIDNL